MLIQCTTHAHVTGCGLTHDGALVLIAFWIGLCLMSLMLCWAIRSLRA